MLRRWIMGFNLLLCFCYPIGILALGIALGSTQIRLGSIVQEEAHLRCRRRLRIV
jgi:hypothetical protein